MKKIFRQLRERIKSKGDLPPPYEENDFNINNEEVWDNLESTRQCQIVDLLANCTLDQLDANGPETEYAEIEEMGLWHSTPLSSRHKSKVSLTWVLKDNLDKKLPQIIRDDAIATNVNTYQNPNQSDRPRKWKREISDARRRVVGRNEYKNYNFKLNTDSFEGRNDSCSDASEIENCRKHRHRHRRKKSKTSARFGYDIKDLDSFLSEASLDRPGNIPVVVSCPSVLYETRGGRQSERELPLGTVVNALFRRREWLYVQTPHHHEGYIVYEACMPLGILPNRSNPPQKLPCWESSTDIYPQPCGNLTDTEKEQMRGRTRSETRHNTRKQKTRSACGELEFDSLYLKTKSVGGHSPDGENFGHKKKPGASEENFGHKKKPEKYETQVTRHMLLVVNSDFAGDILNNTVTVTQGEVVVLVQGGNFETDVDSEWFYVRKRDGRQGFIPAVITGHGYI